MNILYLFTILMCNLIFIETIAVDKREGKTCVDAESAKEEEERNAQKAVANAKDAQSVVAEKLQQVDQLNEAIREAQSVIDEETEGLNRLHESYKATCIATKTSQKQVEHLRKSFKMAKVILSKLVSFQGGFEAQILKTTQLVEFAKKKITELFEKLQRAEKQLCKAKQNAKKLADKANKCISQQDSDTAYDFDIL